MLDYAVGALLFFAPFLFRFKTGGIEQWLLIFLGTMTAVMSLLTDDELSMIRWIPFRIHLGADTVGGVLLAGSPWLFSLADII